MNIAEEVSTITPSFPNSSEVNCEDDDVRASLAAFLQLGAS